MKQPAVIKLDFKDMPYSERFELWWGFTLAILFKQNTKPQSKVPNVDIFVELNPIKKTKHIKKGRININYDNNDETK